MNWLKNKKFWIWDSNNTALIKPTKLVQDFIEASIVHSEVMYNIVATTVPPGVSQQPSDGKKMPMSRIITDAILDKLQNRLSRPALLTVPCILVPFKVHRALYDWGASMNILPKMVNDCLDKDPLVPIPHQLWLADFVIMQPNGIAKDVLIEFQDSSTLVYFMVMDMDPHQRTSIILGKPFLKLVRATIDKKRGIINIKVDTWFMRSSSTTQRTSRATAKFESTN
jgi:hypothetical protein